MHRRCLFEHYNPSMPRILRFLFFAFFIASCTPTPLPSALFFTIRRADTLTLVLQSGPDSSQPLREIPLMSPSDCSFWSLTPAPAGAFVALEWQCGFGPSVQVLDVSTGKSAFLLDNQTLDNRFLAWNPAGKAVHIKAGTLSEPHILRVEAESRRATVLPVPPNTYNLSFSPDGGSMLYALTNGIGLGSELWVADAGGTNGRILLSDAHNIIGLMRYSPDGQHIAYIRLPDSQSAFPAGELWLMDADGNNARLTASADAGRGMPPVWSPDGSQVAFTGRTNPEDPNAINLSIYDILTSQLLISSVSPATPPVWSPDAAKLYFTLAIDDKMEVWFYEISTKRTRKLLDSACCPGWMH
jgi:Tol biopolymer transport system component